MSTIANFRMVNYAEQGAIAHLMNNPNSDQFEKQVLARIGHFCGFSLTLIIGITETAFGLICSVGVILTLTLYKPISGFTTDRLLSGASQLILFPYIHLLKTVNPAASHKNPFPEGIVSYFLCKQLSSIYWNNINSTNVIQKQLCTRIISLLVVSANIIGGGVDLSIGLIAAAISILTVGYFENMNTLAMEGLGGASHILGGAFCSTVCIFNPWAFENLWF